MPDPEIFSRITLLTTATLGCPVSLVSIVEGQRQWFLGRTGFPLAETPIAHSFCTHCVTAGAPLLIDDARTDPRFSDNALVTGAPLIRSYLGVPIRFEGGDLLGTLCAISPLPGAFTAAQIKPLEMLAEFVEQNIALYARTRELRRKNATLREAARVFRHAEMAANIGFWRVDLATDALHWSDQAHVIHGLEPSRQQVTIEEALGFYTEADRAVVSAQLDAAALSGVPVKFETHITRKDGALRRIRVMGERIDRDGRPDCIAGIVQDCTEEHLSNLALQRAAQHDRLTGLFNRAEFDRRLNIAMQTADRAPVTVAVLDLDGFKEINDTLGHLAGDQVLTALAGRFQRIIGPEVFLARWGGDEFALLFPPTIGLTDASVVAERLIAETRLLSAESPQFELLGATCGMARTDEILPGEELIRRADLALYKGKQEAPGMVVVWDETLEARQSARKLAAMRLRHALDEGEAFAAYQPIIDLETGQIAAFEALLRLPDGRGGVLAACEIFSALLDPVLSRRVSQMMIRQIVREGPQLLAAFGPECRIAINLSEADLREGDFAHQILGLIEGSVLEPTNLTIEVTETMLLSDETGGLRASLKLLNQAGCTIALDDFGTGFSSLSNLRRFPIRKLKIDREFIASIECDSQSRLIIQAIVEMGRGLGLRVVAEGVETAAQEEFLRQIGCTHVQGYRYGHPQPLDGWLAEARAVAPNQRRRA
ncbi:MAG: putative bifunctional diguanylate cyclase/phosphodiesterase [Erythrobacter sp.]